MTGSCRFVPLGPAGLITQEKRPGREVCSGRATAIAIHPIDSAIVYVGTAGGGVWKTTDAGAHWRALTDRQWSLSVGAIAIDPANPDRIYVGTGEANITDMRFVSEGLLISDDAGSTWRRLILSAPGQELTMISRIAVSPAGDQVFIGTDVGLFLLQPQQPVGSQVTLLDADPVSDLVFDGGSGRLFIAKRSQGMALWNGTGAPAPLGRTGDPATAFPDLEPLVVVKDGTRYDFRLALAWIPAEPRTLFVAIAQDAQDPAPSLIYAIMRSDDAGATWAAVAGPPGPGGRTGVFLEQQAVYNLLFGRDPSAPSNLYLGLGRLYRSTALGADWSLSARPKPAPLKSRTAFDDDLHADQHTIAFASTGEIWVGNDGGVWRSATGGQTWHHRNRGLATMQLYHGNVDADLPGLILGGSQDNGFQKFEGHPLWQFSVLADVGMVAIDTKKRRIWIALNKGAIWVDEDGQGFGEISFPPHVGGDPFSAFAIAPSDPDVVYVGSGELFLVDVDRTTAIPLPEYAQVSHGSVSAIAVAATNSRLLYVAAGDTTYTHAGVARVELGSPAVDLKLPPETDEQPTGRYISDLAISPRDPDRLYVTIGEQLGGVRGFRPRLYRCDARTKNWTDLTGNLPSFELDGSSRDATWNPIHAIVIDPDPAVTDPALEHVYVGCDRGVFRSWNGGDSWEIIDHGLPLTPVYDLRFQPSTRRLLAFTHGRGVWMRAADVAPCPGPVTVTQVDLYLRDERYDIGLTPTPLELPDPLRLNEPAPSGDDEATEDEAEVSPARASPLLLHSFDGVDLKIDCEAVASQLADEDAEPAFQDPASTVDYSDDGPLDAIGFEALDHRAPHPKAPARVYLQVHNRGPDEARDVVVRVYWAAQAAHGGYPDLPVDFWSQFPATDPAVDSPWQPIGPASIVASVRPAEPEIVSWTWNVPAKLPSKIGLLAIVTSADDPVDEGQPLAALERKIDPLVRNNKRVLLKTSDTVQAAVSSGGAWRWLKWVGLAAGVGVGAAVLYEELK